MKEPLLKVTCPTIEEEFSVRVSVVPASVLRKVNDADKPFIVLISQTRYPISSVHWNTATSLKHSSVTLTNMPN